MASTTGVLYIGVTNSLYGRVLQHKQADVKGFTERYRCKKLVWYEEYQYIDQAIAREKQLKKWRREKKTGLISSTNPAWQDLAMDWHKSNEISPLRPAIAGLRSK